MLGEQEGQDPMTGSEGQRWGQLTYTSFDPGNGASGGWQLKETSGNLSNGEVHDLQSRVVTWFDPVKPLSPFPSPGELETMPRRLTYVADERGRGTYWHSVMAGRDSTGRPGNVFSHVVLDRAVNTPKPAIRPIELWRSPDLLCPYGPEEVFGAVLGNAGCPRFADALDRTAVLDFLFDPSTWRVGLLSVLLDAVSGAMRGDRPVVLLTDSAESGAFWLAAVSSLMSPSTARAMSFSVYERAGALTALFERGVVVACVPHEDSALLAQSEDFLIFDEHEMPTLGEVDGQQHEIKTGSRIAPTPWSELAQAGLVDRPTAEAALAELDAVSLRLGGATLDPCWPLAMTAVRLPELFADVQPEAAAAIARYSPLALEGDGELLALAMQTIRRQSPKQAKSVWDELQNSEVSPLIRDLLVRVYIERVLAEAGTWAATGPIPLPQNFRPQYVDADLKAAAAQTLTELSRNFSSMSALISAGAAMRLLDFLCRAGLLGCQGQSNLDRHIDEATKDIVERVVTASVDDDEDCSVLVAEIGELSHELLARIVLEAVERTDRFNTANLGDRVPAPFRAWLLRYIPTSDFEAFLLGSAREVPTVLGEAAIWRIQSGAGQLGKARTVAALSLLQGGDGRPRPVCWDAVFDPEQGWQLSELLELERRHPCGAPGGIFLRTLASADQSPELDSLIQLILHQRGREELTGPEVSLAELRSLSGRAWTGTTYLTQSELASSLLKLADLAVQNAEKGELPGEVSDSVLVSAIVSLSEPELANSCSRLVDSFFLGYRLQPGSKAATILEQLVDRGSFDELALRRIISAAAESAPGYPHPTGTYPMSTVVLNSPQGPVRLLEVPVRRALAGRRSRHELLDFLLSRELNVAMTAPSDRRGGERRAEKIYEDRERFVRSWWQTLLPVSQVDDELNSKPVFFGVFKSSNRKDR